MKKLPKEKSSKDVDLRQLDNEVIDVYKPDNKSYPIIERTNNALIWPEKIKDGIDLDERDVTPTPLNSIPPLESVELSKDKNYTPE